MLSDTKNSHLVNDNLYAHYFLFVEFVLSRSWHSVALRKKEIQRVKKQKRKKRQRSREKEGGADQQSPEDSLSAKMS